MVWETNVKNYWEETETYYITDIVGQEEEYDDDDHRVARLPGHGVQTSWI